MKAKICAAVPAGPRRTPWLHFPAVCLTADRQHQAIGNRAPARQIEDDNGARTAHHVLAALRRMMNWYASRYDDFRSPIVRGMSRIKPKERARTRVLSDEELRAVWQVADTFGPYGRMSQFILLTAARLRKSAMMTRDELSADGSEWLIPAARYKGKHDHLVPLSGAAQRARRNSGFRSQGMDIHHQRRRADFRIFQVQAAIRRQGFSRSCASRMRGRAAALDTA